jgi:hypothetical protein
MFTRRVVERLRAQDWVAVLLELIIVVIGIFIAIQVDRWWADRDRELREHQYVVRLKEDIVRDSVSLTHSIQLAEQRQQFADLLIQAAEDPEVVEERPVEFMIAVHQSAYTATPALNSDTMEELRSTGNLGLLTNESLKSALFDYYRYDEASRQYLSLQLMTEFKHFELAAGILTNRQITWLWDNVGIVDSSDMETATHQEVELQSVRSAARRLREKPEFVAWLPEARGMQTELIFTHGHRLAKAEALLAILRGIISEHPD